MVTRKEALAFTVGTVLLHQKGKQTCTVTEACTVYEGNKTAFTLPVVSPKGQGFSITHGNADRWTLKTAGKGKLVIAKAAKKGKVVAEQADESDDESAEG